MKKQAIIKTLLFVKQAKGHFRFFIQYRKIKNINTVEAKLR